MAEQDQSLVLPPGTCYQPSSGEVPCSVPHLFEVTGSVNITNRATTLPPNQDYGRLVGADCKAKAQAYLKGELQPDEVALWLSIKQESWDAGRRIVECVALKVDSDGNPVSVQAPLR